VIVTFIETVTVIVTVIVVVTVIGFFAFTYFVVQRADAFGIGFGDSEPAAVHTGVDFVAAVVGLAGVAAEVGQSLASIVAITRTPENVPFLLRETLQRLPR
jgi:hypothetical protein